jgi:hypothetical protein
MVTGKNMRHAGSVIVTYGTYHNAFLLLKHPVIALILSESEDIKK